MFPRQDQPARALRTSNHHKLRRRQVSLIPSAFLLRTHHQQYEAWPVSQRSVLGIRLPTREGLRRHTRQAWVAISAALASPTTGPCSLIHPEPRRPCCGSDRRGETVSAAAGSAKAAEQPRPKSAATVQCLRDALERTRCKPLDGRDPTRLCHPLTGKGRAE